MPMFLYTVTLFKRKGYNSFGNYFFTKSAERLSYRITFNSEAFGGFSLNVSIRVD